MTNGLNLRAKNHLHLFFFLPFIAATSPSRSVTGGFKAGKVPRARVRHRVQSVPASNHELRMCTITDNYFGGNPLT